MSDNQLATQQAAQQMAPLRDQMSYAEAIAQSNIIPDAYRGKPANVMVAMNFGQSMGLSPAESLYRIAVIKGKPTMSAELIAAQVRKAGHKLRIRKDEAAQSVTATVVRCDDPDYPISVTRDIAWAKSMGLAGNDNYRKQPMTMLTWRAITAVAREACPEALFGVAYTPDEMHDMDAGQAPQEAQQPAREVADLQPLRELFPAFTAATGATGAQAVAAVCAKYGVGGMSELTPEQATDAATWMRQQVDAAARRADGEGSGDQGAEAAEAKAEPVARPDMYDEDVEF